MNKPVRYDLWDQKEYNYGMACGFMPNIRAYIHDTKENMSSVLVVPGGGYCNVSNTEGEIVAEKFYNAGYQAFVLTYTTNPLFNEPLKMQPLNDISRAVRLIRSKSEEFYIKSDKVAICGFSAGSHLCGSLCVHYADVEDKKYPEISNRPDGAILSYPVITSGKFAHQDSFRALLGADIYKDKNAAFEGIPGCKTAGDALEYMSIEKHVTKNTMPCFLWHTVTDDCVSMENSMMFAKKLKECGVNFAYHLYSYGGHGLSLANQQWADRKFGGEYTEEQMNAIKKAVEDGKLDSETAEKYKQVEKWTADFMAMIEKMESRPNWEAAGWIDAALLWMDNLMK